MFPLTIYLKTEKRAQKGELDCLLLKFVTQSIWITWRGFYIGPTETHSHICNKLTQMGNFSDYCETFIC